jgi:hypothetical protein
VASIAADAAREAHETGVDPREVAAALYVSPGEPRRSVDDAAERRRVLREQIASLERTLGEIEAKHPGVVPASTATRGGGGGPALLDAAELEHVRTLLVRRLTTVQAAIDGLGNEAAVSEQEATSKQPAVAKEANKERQPRAKPASRRVPRAQPPMRPAREGA